MIRALRARIQQGLRTVAYPAGTPTLPDRYRGRPVLAPDPLVGVPGPRGIDACPTGAMARSAERGLTLDLGRCLFCGECERTCPDGAVRWTREHRMAARRREDLVVDAGAYPECAPLDGAMKRLLGRSFKLRQVSAGGCNACEADTNVLTTVVFDLSRFGIQFVASPRHADGLLITGPVTKNMELALRKTWEAVPEPRVVIAVGACAISGGPYAGHEEVCDGAASVVPVDLFIPGCPPHPLTILDGLLSLLGRG